MPKGAKLFQILNRFVEDEEEKRGYLITKTPYLSKHNLFLASGHWAHYKDKMFVMGDEKNEEEEILTLRPMTCPFQFQIYNNGLKSYRDLPIRYGETSTLFRKEASGEMHGLIRIRQFTLSEGHIICTPEQIEKEFTDTVNFIYYILDCLGLREDISFRFSKWDPNDREKYIDNEQAWNTTQAIMKKILDNLGMNYVEAEGEAAFYGPKLDIQIKNVHGKEDTLITVQVDFFLPERLDMSYIDESGQKVRPTIIHRSSIGCYERTIALLIEKYAGAFPTWFAPIQVRLLALTGRSAERTSQLTDELKKLGIRAEADLRNEKIGYKIREAQLEKIPYMIIIGDKEVETGNLAVRGRKEGDLGSLSFEQFVEKIKYEIDNKIIN
jgi:threonyl-tRNA synthetase